MFAVIDYNSGAALFRYEERVRAVRVCYHLNKGLPYDRYIVRCVGDLQSPTIRDGSKKPSVEEGLVDQPREAFLANARSASRFVQDEFAL